MLMSSSKTRGLRIRNQERTEFILKILLFNPLRGCGSRFLPLPPILLGVINSKPYRVFVHKKDISLISDTTPKELNDNDLQ